MVERDIASTQGLLDDGCFGHHEEARKVITELTAAQAVADAIEDRIETLTERKRMRHHDHQNQLEA